MGSRGDYGGDNRGSRGNYGSERGSGYTENRGGEYGGDARSAGGTETVKVKQCDENCDERCDNARIYITGLPLDVTIDELRELFGGIGQVILI